MKITPIVNNSTSFCGQYKTEDVLRLLTGYSYRNKATDSALINSLSGIDIYSDEFKSKLPKDALFLCAVCSVEMSCQEEILRQHPELQGVYDSFDCKLHLTEGKKSQNDWFRKQLKKLSPTIELLPFELSREECEKKYKAMKSALEKIL